LSAILTEIRWHARGGQGAVTAAKMVAELAVERGKHFQAFPEYGPERSGAPIVAFTRISDEPIQIYSPIEHPNLVLVLDATLLGANLRLKSRLSRTSARGGYAPSPPRRSRWRRSAGASPTHP
jgi:2-oxoacid:acceptor oxidoreductase gamma subunit (pyruvate/2-ketoisovalerate family)